MSDKKLPAFSSSARNLNLGRWRHFKGGEYTVLGVGRNSEDLSEQVIYQARYGNHDIWLRSLSEFLSSVDKGDGPTPRFTYIGNTNKK